MKSLRVIGVSLALLAAVVCQAQQLSTHTLFSSSGSVSQVASAKLTTLTNVCGRKDWTLDVHGFGGLTYGSGRITGGIGLSRRVPFAREVDLDLGLYAQSVAGKRPDWGVFFGFTFKG